MHFCLKTSVWAALMYRLKEVRAPPKVEKIELFYLRVICAATLPVPQ